MAFFACPNRITAAYVKHIQDVDIIPDKHNCGLSNPNATFTVYTLTESGSETAYMASKEGVQVPFTRTGGNFYINPNSYSKFWQSTTPATYTIEDCDFSASSFSLSNPQIFGATFKLIFKNCKFSKIELGTDWGTNKTNHGIETVFEHCDFVGTYGSFRCNHTEVNYCTFHDGHGGDLANPVTNAHFNNCYFYDLLPSLEFGKGLHQDGVQCFGDSSSARRTGNDVTFCNCRFEFPDYFFADRVTGDPYISSCLSVGLDYSGLTNFSANNCHLNGGGYTIYASKTKNFPQEPKSFQSLKIGSLKRNGIRYPNAMDVKALWENVTEEDKLTVSSVWKENGDVHFLVSNDTATAKTLVVMTDSGTEYTFSIPQNYTGITLCESGITNFNSLPFDIEKIIEEDAEYVVFYDSSVSEANQIRFEDFL